jgi:Leucine-rich repeat (LRR) protein
MRFLILEQGSIAGTIPSEYSELERLLILDMDFNDLTGSLPDGVYDLSALQQLDLNDNEITGSISSRIGDLSQLAFFQIDHNLLTGTIPSEMGLLTNLSKCIQSLGFVFLYEQFHAYLNLFHCFGFFAKELRFSVTTI